MCRSPTRARAPPRASPRRRRRGRRRARRRPAARAPSARGASRSLRRPAAVDREHRAGERRDLLNLHELLRRLRRDDERGLSFEHGITSGKAIIVAPLARLLFASAPPGTEIAPAKALSRVVED